MEQKQPVTPEMLRMLKKNAIDVLETKKMFLRLTNLPRLPKKTMDACYTAAYNFYRQGNYNQSLDVFTKLCMFDDSNAKYWQGLGMTRQMLKDFSGAVEAYSFASALDFTNPKPHYHSAQCLLALKRDDKAKDNLKVVISIVNTSEVEKEEYKKIAEEARSLLEEIEVIQKKEGTYIS